jgi:murein DD-endopeptidase MepM/ murein hydrolase activator NlpD
MHEPLNPSPESRDTGISEPDGQNNTIKEGRWILIWENLIRLGLGETSLRIITAVFSVALVLLVIWVMGNYYLKGQPMSPGGADNPASPPATPPVTMGLPPVAPPMLDGLYLSGIGQQKTIHTSQLAKPREDIETYEVQKGDTIFGISEKYGLAPETILWSNINTLGDNVDKLSPGQQLNILPLNGVYYQWHAGDGLNGVADYFKVKPDDIINYPLNHLDKNSLGDYAHPNIKDGTWLVVPGGKRDLINWGAPFIARTDPAQAKVFGPGYCGQIMAGPVGRGTFILPTGSSWVSGYDYTPPIHYGIDFGGHLNDPIHATDAGVVVYAGWNNWGYGNVIVVDHGSGWQSLYAHLNSLNVQCGSPVQQGEVIAAMGTTGNSTGPHLHFELIKGDSKSYTRVNPWSFLPK